MIEDDGVANIKLRSETSAERVYSKFQYFIRPQKLLGVTLNIDFKNDEENALLRLKHPDSRLSTDDFIH